MPYLSNNFQNLSGVGVSAPADGDYLVYDAATQTWVNAPGSDNDITIIRGHLNMSSTAVDTFARTTNTANALVSGTVYFTFFTPLASRTVSQITMSSAGTQAATVTTVKMGLYTWDGTTATLVAQTANDATVFTSTFTAYTRSFSTTGGFPATYDLVAGTRYALGLIVVATTMPSVYMSNSFVPNSLNTLDPRLSGTATGQTDLVASRNSFTSSTLAPWGRFS